MFFEAIKNKLHTLLHDHGLIFIGYGAGDQGIRKMLESLPSEALPRSVC
jgi:hypothetical protein